MNNKFIVMAILFCGGIAHAMENAENNSLTAIQKWQDVTPFAGKVVAYTATTNYLDSKTYKYLLPASSLSYGYIDESLHPWEGCGDGYNLSQLIKKNGVPGNKALADEFISKGSLCMREVTSQEAREIIEALTPQKANFDYQSGKKIISKLQLIAKQ